MMIKDIFNHKRFFLLVRNAVWKNASKILLVAGVITTLVVLISGMSAFHHIQAGLHLMLYSLFLFGSGFLVTSNAFRDLSKNKTAGAWLMLPASTFEKFISRLFLTSVGYVAGTMVIYFIISALSEVINQVMFSFSHPFFNPFTPKILKVAAAYLVLQSIFLTGAIYFRRFAFIKTILFLSLVCLVSVLFSLVTIKLIWGGDFNSPAENGIRVLWDMLSSEWLIQVKNTLCWMLKTLFWCLLAPFCWLISYFRLKEFEA